MENYPTDWTDVKIDGRLDIFKVPTGFEFVKRISGEFGTLCQFRNPSTHHQIAVKKLCNVLGDEVDAERILREVKLLTRLSCEQVVKIIGLHMSEDTLFIAQDFMHTSLRRIIDSRQNLSEEHHQHFLHSILCGLHYIHSANVMHRDVKPAHVLVNTNDEVKLCDFTLAQRTVDPDEEGSCQLTDYVVTRWYRAPEVALLPHKYTQAIDLWSAGCILAELYQRRPIFQGRDYLDQLKKIFAITGLTEADMDWLPATCKARSFIEKFSGLTKQPWQSLLPSASLQAVEALESLICLHPGRRATTKDALALPFFSGHAEDGPQTAATPFDWSFVSLESTKSSLQMQLLDECKRLHQCIVVGLHVACIDEDGSVGLNCHSMSGELITTVTTHVGQKVGVIRKVLNEQRDMHSAVLQLVTVNGRRLRDAEQVDMGWLLLAEPNASGSSHTSEKLPKDQEEQSQPASELHEGFSNFTYLLKPSVASWHRALSIQCERQ